MADKIGSRRRAPGPVVEHDPVNVCLYGATNGVVDLGESYPSEIIPIADLRTNSGYKVSIRSMRWPSTVQGTAFASACTGLAFTNQPANDGVEVLSDTAGDVSRQVTIYGTTTGTNFVVAETVTLNASDGTTAVSTTKTDWGYILGVEVATSHATAIITVREASGNAAITTIAAEATSSGITAATTQTGYGVPVSVVANNTTTKVVGVVGTNAAGTTIYDAITLSNTEAVNGRNGMTTVTKLLHGDLESNRTVTFSVGHLSFESASEQITDTGASDNGEDRRIEGRYLWWVCYNGTTLAQGGERDYLHIKRYY